MAGLLWTETRPTSSSGESNSNINHHSAQAAGINAVVAQPANTKMHPQEYSVTQNLEMVCATAHPIPEFLVPQARQQGSVGCIKQGVDTCHLGRSYINGNNSVFHKLIK